MIRQSIFSSPTRARIRPMTATAIPVSFWTQTPRSQYATRWAQPAKPATAAMPVDVFATGDQAVIRAALPGVDPEQIEVSVYRNTVTVRAELPSDNAYRSDQVSWLVAELGRGTFERTIQLPFQIEEQQVEAQFANGMLQLLLPRMDTDKPHRISVQVRPELTQELPAGESQDESFAAD